MSEPEFTEETAYITLEKLTAEGWIIGVTVFGTNTCCEHGENADCRSTGFGLCDGFSEHAVGSDCNRAERWLMRPKDGLMRRGLAGFLREDEFEDGPNQ